MLGLPNLGLKPGYGSLNAFSAVKKAIRDDAADVNILVIGDSTGDATNEWAYLFASWLGEQYPTHSVDYRLWNNTTKVYDAAATLATGSGAHTITLWNASVSGSMPIDRMGADMEAAIVSPAPELVIWNHGHNLVTAYAIGASVARGELLNGMEQVRQALPGVPHAAFRQNPRRDDTAMAPIVSIIDSVAADYGDLTLLDAYSVFESAGKPAGWYSDNQHPNGTGQSVFLTALTNRWRAASAGNISPVAAFLDAAGTNLLANSDFAVGYAGGTPTGWTNTNATAEVEASIVDGDHAQCMKLTGTAANSRIHYALPDLSLVRGKRVTLAVRQRVSASGGSVGRIAIRYNTGTAVAVYTQSRVSIADGGFRWVIIAGLEIPAEAVSCYAELYVEGVVNVDSAVYLDRAILVVGDVPRDLA